ncbi:MAG TPA: glutamine synthetase [Candidatus Limivivens merdigallinarum]|uniref:Glutamine synthetase n=1 Tax=Candidatus Limivivens merdigallinarum TaxID=2840859 RepID=A0A9D0ZSI4_9FIRM|nr:glutamine synthetase [Candidatus Limivivens merdigallinarum]
MDGYSRDEILEMVEEEDVEFIRLQFTDMFGNLKNIAVTSGQLTKALDNECGIDVSSIAGFEKTEGEELYLYPDYRTFTILPWRPQQNKVARLLCDIGTADGKPYELSCRSILKKVLEKAAEEGYEFYVEPECEFFLFHTDDNGVPTTLTHEKAGYMDLSPVDLGENARRDMVLTLEEMGFNVISSYHEAAPAQHEIDFKAGKALRSADMLMTFKMAVRTTAKRHGLHATFMPKPRSDFNGSGMHIRMSLWKDGKEVFQDPSDANGLSEEGYYFIGGLLEHCRAMMAVTNPLVNSYKRLLPGNAAPTQISWSRDEETSLVGVKKRRNESLKIELRSPDASANPYLVLALCLAAGMDGIQKRQKPSETSEKLPENLKEALETFGKDPWVRETLGDRFCERYLKAKEQEWLDYVGQISDWEREQYLYRI